MFIADVGQNEFEEVNLLTVDASRGGNFGWSVFEGAECFHGPCDAAGMIAPTVVYGHNEGCSVTGGYVYRGSAIPELTGHYFYGDYCSGTVHSFRFDGIQITEDRDWPELSVAGLSSFGLDGSCELHIVSHRGTIFRVEHS